MSKVGEGFLASLGAVAPSSGPIPAGLPEEQPENMAPEGSRA